MITPLLKFLRNLRLYNTELLKDMADKLGTTSAELSAVEIGRVAFPAEWIDLIVSIYKLDAEAKSALEDAILETQKMRKPLGHMLSDHRLNMDDRELAKGLFGVEEPTDVQKLKAKETMQRFLDSYPRIQKLISESPNE